MLLLATPLITISSAYQHCEGNPGETHGFQNISTSSSSSGSRNGEIRERERHAKVIIESLDATMSDEMKEDTTIATVTTGNDATMDMETNKHAEEYGKEKDETMVDKDMAEKDVADNDADDNHNDEADKDHEEDNSDDESKDTFDTEDDGNYDFHSILAKRHRYKVKNVTKGRTRAASAIESAVNDVGNFPKDNSNEKTVSDKDIFLNRLFQKTSRFGIRLTRVEHKSKVSILPNTIHEFVKILETCDPEAIILPHNNSHVKAMTISDISNKKGMDYTTYFDSQVVRWGHPREETFRLSLSFYIASDEVEPHLKQLRNNPELVEFLQNNGLSMSPHTLHESRDANIGFLLGKSQQFTWNEDIKRRLQRHLHYHLNRSPELSIKAQTIKSEGHTAEVLSIFAGLKDSKAIQETLRKSPFREVEIIMQSLKTEGKESYQQQIQIHNALIDRSKAVKICNIFEYQITALRHKCEDDNEAKMRIVDLARYRNSEENAVVYAQCHEVHKEWVQKWITKALCDLPTLQLNQQPPFVAQQDNTSRNDVTSKNTGRGSRTSSSQVTYESRFQYM